MAKSSDDPRGAGGRMYDAGAPSTRGQVMFDSRNAVIVEEIETAVAHVTQKGNPAPDVVALSIHGRINRPPDKEIPQKWCNRLLTREDVDEMDQEMGA